LVIATPSLLRALEGDCAKGVPLVIYTIPKRKFTKNGAVLSKLYQNEGFKEFYLRFLQATKFGILSVVWDLEQMLGIPNSTKSTLNLDFIVANDTSAVISSNAISSRC